MHASEIIHLADFGSRLFLSLLHTPDRRHSFQQCPQIAHPPRGGPPSYPLSPFYPRISTPSAPASVPPPPTPPRSCLGRAVPAGPARAARALASVPLLCRGHIRRTSTSSLAPARRPPRRMSTVATTKSVGLKPGPAPKGAAAAAAVAVRNSGTALLEHRYPPERPPSTRASSAADSSVQGARR